MKKAIGAACLVIGIILLIFGYNEYTSISSDISEAFTGSPTDSSVWYLAGGAGALVVGIILLVSKT